MADVCNGGCMCIFGRLMHSFRETFFRNMLSCALRMGYAAARLQNLKAEKYARSIRRPDMTRRKTAARLAEQARNGPFRSSLAKHLPERQK